MSTADDLPDPRCETCIFWQEQPEEARRYTGTSKHGPVRPGLCRRFPPSAGRYSKYPVTQHCYWCGEHTPLQGVEGG